MYDLRPKFTYIFVCVEYWLESDKDIMADIELPQTLDAAIASTNSEQSKSIVWWIILFVNVFQTVHLISD